MKRRIALAALVLAASGAAAQDKVYRCGPDGRSYSATPCPNGREVDVADRRSPEQQQAAQDVARRDADLADALRQERLQRERARKPGAASLGVPPPAASAASSAHAQGKKKRRTQRGEEGVREALGPPRPRPGGR